MMQSRYCPASSTTVFRSSAAHCVSIELIRTTTVFSPQSLFLRASTTLPRASSFASGATESSRSMNTMSAGSVGPFASIFGLEPGTERQDLRARQAVPPVVALLDVAEATEVVLDLSFFLLVEARLVDRGRPGCRTVGTDLQRLAGTDQAGE